jgi:hypothetical protein
MRVHLVKYALIPLVTLALVGCQSSPSTIKMPKVSMSKLNPFSKGPAEDNYPPKPSGLAAGGTTSPAGAGYADANSAAPKYDGYSSLAPSYDADTNPRIASTYPSPSASTPSASTGSLARSAVSTNPATTPQSGHYDTGGGYGQAAPSDQVSAGPGSSRYGVVADRYGLNRGGSQTSADPGFGRGSPSTYPSTPSYVPPTLGSQSAGPRYDSGASPEYSPKSGSRYAVGPNDSRLSVADSRRDSGSSYGLDARSLVGDRYASQDAQAGGLNSRRNGDVSNSSGDASWTPGQTGYVPGQSDYRPGDTGYRPGDTGYHPPGTRPYRSPADSFSSEPFLPGSIKTYAPRTTSGPATPEESLSRPQDQPTIDSQVIPAGHDPASRTRLF